LLELKDDTLVVEGFTPASIGGYQQIAIRERENSELKSLIFPNSDWDLDRDSQSKIHTVSFKDFSATTAYVINLDRTDKWSVEAKAYDQDGRFIALQSHSQYSPLKDGESINIYLNNALDINDIKLNIRSNNYPSSYSYNWIYPSIPTEIPFK
jgi:hypothetical protein